MVVSSLWFLQDEMKPDYLKTLPNTLKQFSDFLGDRKWFAGDKVYLFINMRGVLYLFIYLFLKLCVQV